MDATAHRARGAGVAVAGRGAVAASRGEPPERVDRLVFIAPGAAAAAGDPAPEGDAGVRRAARRRTIGWGKWNRHYWLEHYEDFLEFFFSQCFTEPHSTKQREDCVGWGARDRRRDAGRDQLGAPAPGRGERARAPRPDRLPGARDPRKRRRDRPCASGARLAELAGGELVVLEGSGHSPMPATRSRSTCCCATSSSPAPPPRSWVRGKSRRKRALYISSPIGLGHAQRDAAIADELRKLHPDLEIDWLAQHPVTAVLEARGERIHPGERLPRERVAPHRERVGRARPALLPGDPADGRDPALQLHGLPRPRPRGAVRPLDRRRGVGARLLPAREPRAEADAVRLADRLRRLAADARRRRPRGVPDRRLQRGDDRAHRALPARARSGRLRRQPRGHRARAVRVPPALDPRVDRGALLLRRLRHGLRSRRVRRPRQRSGPSSATARTSRSASSPSAARASAATSCGA